MKKVLQESDNSPTRLNFDSAPLRTVVEILWRWRRFVVGTSFIFSSLAVTYFAIWGSFSSSSSFTPQSTGTSLGALSGLAAQFGGKLPGGLGGEVLTSLDFYVALIRSPQFLAKLAEHRYRFSESETDTTTHSGDLIQLYGISGATEETRRRRIIERLQNRVSVSVNRMGEIVTVRVKAPWPGLAKAVNRQILVMVNDFNLNQRQSTATFARQFLDSRLKVAKSELASAEEAQRSFLRMNKIYASDPGLALEAARLQRQVDLRQSLFVSLSQSLEDAKMEEVRNTPVITILDEPELFTKRSRSLFLIGMGGFSVFLFGFAAIALFLEALVAAHSTGSNRVSSIYALYRSAIWLLRGRD